MLEMGSDIAERGKSILISQLHFVTLGGCFVAIYRVMSFFIVLLILLLILFFYCFCIVNAVVVAVL